MSSFFKEGEKKERPGLYKRYGTDSEEIVASAIDGRLAFPFSTDWGPLNTIVEITGKEYSSIIKSTYGTGGHTKMLRNMMAAGLTTLYACRVGTGGSCGTISLKSSSATVATISLKYPSEAKFSATLRKSAADSSMYELIIYLDDMQMDKISFATYDELVNCTSSYVTVKGEMETVPDMLPELTMFVNSEFEGGVNPTVTAADYEAGIKLLETKRYNVLTADTIDPTICSLISEYNNLFFENGKTGICVVGNTSLDFVERMAAAKAFDGMLTAYFGSSFLDSDGNVINNAEAVTLAAAVIAATPSNQSITHIAMPKAAGLAESLTDTQYTNAIKNGLLLLSASSEGTVWFDSGINTLVTPTADQDDGWKKIRRTKTRLELFDRLDRTIEPIIGRVTNDDEGNENIVHVAQKVIDAMVDEKKLKSGSIAIDEASGGYAADYAHFIITVVDLDSLEKIYLNYRFKYSA